MCTVAFDRRNRYGGTPPMLVTISPRIADRLIKSGKANRFVDFSGVEFTAILTGRKGSTVYMDLPLAVSQGSMNRKDFRLMLPNEEN
jgi:hypothetical protein